MFFMVRAKKMWLLSLVSLRLALRPFSPQLKALELCQYARSCGAACWSVDSKKGHHLFIHEDEGVSLCELFNSTEPPGTKEKLR